MMARPPKVKKKLKEFSLDIPDMGHVKQVKHYKSTVKKAIMQYRQLVLLNGQIARDLMLLHSKLEQDPAEVQAMFEWGAHSRGVRDGAEVKCRFKTIHDNVVFTAVKLAYYLHEFIAERMDDHLIKIQLAKLMALGTYGLKNFQVKGDDRNGYYMRLRKGYGLSE